MGLDPQKYEEYWFRGWTVVEGVFAAPEVDTIGQLAISLCEPEITSADSSYNADLSKDGRLAPRKLDNPFLKHRDLRNFVMDRRLRALVEELIRRPPMLINDQMFMKPPRFGSAKPYHQDNAYFLCHPDDEVITAWIALDDVDEFNGCLRYISGSHRGPILEHLPIPGEPYNTTPATEQIDLTQEAPACVKKGGVVFHHSKTLHTSHRNESDKWRRAYASHWGSAAVTSEIDTIDGAYFNRSPELYKESLAGIAEPT
tara:strand:- start:3595 stop:4365 length:771 start_codon:yes stop_codon:yes gene_type:complete